MGVCWMMLTLGCAHQWQKLIRARPTHSSRVISSTATSDVSGLVSLATTGSACALQATVTETALAGQMPAATGKRLELAAF